MLKVREARPHDADDIRDLIGEYVSMETYPKSVSKLFTSHDSRPVVAVDDTEIVGVMCFHRIDSVEEVVEGLNGTQQPEPDEIAVGGDEFGVLSTAFVTKDRLRSGIGRLLLNACLNHAIETGCEALYVEADAYNEDRDGRTLLEEQGFESVFEADNYWDFDECPVCGDECDCGMVIYRMEL